MKKNIIRVLTLAMAILMVFSVAGCKNDPETYSYWLSEDVIVEGDKTQDNDDKTGNEDSGNSDSGNSGSGNSGSGNSGSGNSGSGNSGSGNSGSSKPSNNKKNTVKVAVGANRQTDYDPMWDALAEAYPEIKVEVDYYSETDSTTYIAAKSATGSLPDIIADDIACMPLYIGQGLVYPITEYVKNDPNSKYIAQSLWNDYTYGGEIYAVPNQCTFTCITLNTDILDDLNMDVPALNWNIADFTTFAKQVASKGNSKNYIFCENLSGLDTNLAGTYNKNVGFYGYNFSNRQFEMVGSLNKSSKLLVELSKVNNLAGFQLSLSDKYIERYGDAVSNYAATKQGKSLIINFELGTYSKAERDEYLANVNWQFHPLPQNTAGRMPIHIDHAFMLSNTKNPDLAYKVLSHMAMSPDSAVARLEAYQDKKAGKADYELLMDFYFPVTKHPDVVAAFKKLMADQPACIYFYENIENCYRGDPDKIVPSFSQNIFDVFIPTLLDIQDGTKDPDQVLPDAQKKLTAGQKVYWDDFDAKLKKVQAEWKAKH